MSPDPGQLPSPPSGDLSAGPSFPGVFPHGHSLHLLLPGPQPPGSHGTGRSLSLEPQVGRESCGPWPLSVLAWRARKGHGEGGGATGLWGLSAQREGSVEADGGGKKRKGQGTKPGAQGRAGLAEAVGPPPLRVPLDTHTCAHTLTHLHTHTLRAPTRARGHTSMRTLTPSVHIHTDTPTRSHTHSHTRGHTQRHATADR